MIEDWTFAHLKREETVWGPHGYHRYPAKFIPQLVHRIIESYSAPNDLVDDPFLGSATTGIEALRLGRRFWGCDISQVALLISRTKCIPLSPCNLDKIWQELDGRLKVVPRAGRRYLNSAEKETIASIDIAYATAEERFHYWFPDQFRESLEGILQQILTYTEGDVRTFFLGGFSNILRRCSIWLSGSTKPQKDLDKMLGDPVDEFRRQVRDMIKGNSIYWYVTYKELTLPGRVSIIDLSDTDSPQVNNFVIAEFLRGLMEAQNENYRETTARGGTAQRRTMIIIEEAHEFLSTERIKQMPFLYQQVARIARRGRKRWLGLVFVTQLPQHLPDEVLGLVNNYILHKIGDANVISRLKRSLGVVDDSLWSRLPNLAPGQALVAMSSFTRPS